MPPVNDTVHVPSLKTSINSLSTLREEEAARSASALRHRPIVIGLG